MKNKFLSIIDLNILILIAMLIAADFPETFSFKCV